MPEDVLEPDEQGELEAAGLGVGDEVGDVHLHAVLQGRRDGVALGVDVEVAGAPAIDVVERA